jgi:hypothetical protein
MDNNIETYKWDLFFKDGTIYNYDNVKWIHQVFKSKLIPELNGSITLNFTDDIKSNLYEFLGKWLELNNNKVEIEIFKRLPKYLRKYIKFLSLNLNFKDKKTRKKFKKLLTSYYKGNVQFTMLDPFRDSIELNDDRLELTKPTTTLKYDYFNDLRNDTK